MIRHVKVGDIVHYILPEIPEAPHRPAIVVNVFHPNIVNLQVFSDGDMGYTNVNWRTSVLPTPKDYPLGNYASLLGTWHFPEEE